MEQKKFKRTTVTAALPYANGGVPKISYLRRASTAFQSMISQSDAM